MEKDRYKGGLHMFPNTNLEEFKEWTPDNLGPIYIPEAGRTIELNQRNIDMYSRVISFFEGHDLDISEEGVRIDGELTKTYTFEQDYYWMMGDNRHNSADSRMWGFIPEDHVIGCASFTWFSKQNMAQHGESKIRWNRMFKSVK
jgi:signal peptidase I